MAGGLSAFLAQNAVKPENIRFAASRRFVDEDGKPMLWELRPLMSEEDEALRRTEEQKQVQLLRQALEERLASYASELSRIESRTGSDETKVQTLERLAKETEEKAAALSAQIASLEQGQSAVSEQAEALAARGVDMAVLYVNVSGDFHPAHNGIHRDDAGGGLTYTYVHPNLTPRWEKGRCIQRTRMLEKLYRRLEKEWGRPDVVNLRSSLQGYEAAALCRRYGVRMILDCAQTGGVFPEIGRASCRERV